MTRLKCSKRGWCDGLRTLLNRANSRVEVAMLYNFATGKETCTGIVYRERPRDRGVMLNFCPMCGASIEPKHPTPTPEAAK